MTPLRMVGSHFRSLAKFYLSSSDVEKKSSFGPDASAERLANSRGQGRVAVRISKRGVITAACAHHSARSNILRSFTGSFEERDGTVILRGRIGIDSGIRFGILFFCFAIFVYVPLISLFALFRGEPFPLTTNYIKPMLFLVTLLEALYLYGGNDDKMIRDHLRQTLIAEGGEPNKVEAKNIL